MKRSCLGAIVLSFACCCVAADGPSGVAGRSSSGNWPSSSTSSSPARVLKFPHLEADLTARQVRIESEVCQRDVALELLLCRQDTKEHESILRTKALAAHLHAALLALDLAPGIPAHWSEEGQDSRFLPPKGAALNIVLRWKDKEGTAHQDDAAQWIKPADGRKCQPPKTWIFVGSDVTPDGAYLADRRELGHVISVSNFADAVIDVPFESSQQNADLEFTADSQAIPPVGTAVEIVITPAADAATAPQARMNLDIDRTGSLSLDGKAVQQQDLQAAAEKFIDRHSLGQVVIRADGAALVDDIARCRSRLRSGGVRDFREVFFSASQDVLPRTKEQSAAAIAQWRQKFDNPQDYIRPLSEQASEELANIAVQLKQLESLRNLWEAYQLELSKDLAEHRAGSQPASEP